MQWSNLTKMWFIFQYSFPSVRSIQVFFHRCCSAWIPLVLICIEALILIFEKVLNCIMTLWSGRCCFQAKCPGGGGGTSNCMHIGYVPRERPPFSALNFRSGAYDFHKLPKKSVPEHHHFKFFGGFCRSGDHHCQNFFNFNPFIASHGRLSPNAKRSAAPRRPGCSGDWNEMKWNEMKWKWNEMKWNEKMKWNLLVHIHKLQRISWHIIKKITCLWRGLLKSVACKL